MLRWSAVAIVLVLSGCHRGPKPVSFREGPREYVAADYDALLERWTRRERVYALQGIDDVLSVDATFESWDFRWAYVIRYAEDYRLTIEQRRELLTSALGDTRNYHQFYVALYGSHANEADLTRDRPAWVVRLVDDKGHVTAPEQIIAIKRPSVLDRAYFPYTSVWRKAYRLRFPTHTAAGPTIAPEATAAVLRFSGPLGNLELIWERARETSAAEPR